MIKKAAVGAGVFAVSALAAAGIALAQTDTPTVSPTTSPSPTVTTSPSPSTSPTPSTSTLPSGAPVTGRGE
jgi:hypothetical protein